MSFVSFSAIERIKDLAQLDTNSFFIWKIREKHVPGPQEAQFRERTRMQMSTKMFEEKEQSLLHHLFYTLQIPPVMAARILNIQHQAPLCMLLSDFPISVFLFFYYVSDKKVEEIWKSFSSILGLYALSLGSPQ